MSSLLLWQLLKSVKAEPGARAAFSFSTKQGAITKMMKQMMGLGAAGLAALLAGCAATSATPQGAAVELTTERPKNCKMLGEVIGSQGNVFSGDFTSDQKLMQGARNDLRNRAAALGANVVQIQNTQNSMHPYSAGAIKSTVVGIAFACPQR